jgi:cytochrome P450
MTPTDPFDAEPPELAGLDTGFFGIEALRALRQDSLGFFLRVAAQCPDGARYRLAGIDVFQLTHPAHHREILVSGARDYGKSRRVRRVLGQWSGNGLALIDGEPWRRQRQLVNPAFKASNVDAHLSTVLRHAHALADQWQDLPEVDVSRGLLRFTLAVAAEALFGAEVTPLLEDLIEQIDVLNECAMRELNSVLLLPRWAPLPSKRRLRDAAGRLEAVVFDMIARARATPARGDRLISILLGSHDDEGRTMSLGQLRDAVVNILLGAHETTATAITWTLYCWSRHLAVQEEARAGLHDVLRGADPDLASLPGLGAIERSVEEALRLYPPAYCIPREASRDLKLGSSGIRRGSIVNLIPFVTHRDPRWFDRPLDFMPSRFEHGRPMRGTYLPFGVGARACIGRRFAMLEAVAALAVLLQRFHFVPAPSQPHVELEAQISLHPRGGLRLAPVAAPAPRRAILSPVKTGGLS